ncbi:hypothetical protein HDU97_001071 [Phlyctochytrium planicorne]|nr:hypothetical protein HDU97_001071 [Phlyctochytrium planicorne]
MLTEDDYSKALNHYLDSLNPMTRSSIYVVIEELKRKGSTYKLLVDALKINTEKYLSETNRSMPSNSPLNGATADVAPSHPHPHPHSHSNPLPRRQPPKKSAMNSSSQQHSDDAFSDMDVDESDETPSKRNATPHTSVAAGAGTVIATTAASTLAGKENLTSSSPSIPPGSNSENATSEIGSGPPTMLSEGNSSDIFALTGVNKTQLAEDLVKTQEIFVAETNKLEELLAKVTEIEGELAKARRAVAQQGPIQAHARHNFETAKRAVDQAKKRLHAAKTTATPTEISSPSQRPVVESLTSHHLPAQADVTKDNSSSSISGLSSLSIANEGSGNANSGSANTPAGDSVSPETPPFQTPPMNPRNSNESLLSESSSSGHVASPSLSTSNRLALLSAKKVALERERKEKEQQQQHQLQHPNQSTSAVVDEIYIKEEADVKQNQINVDAERMRHEETVQLKQEAEARQLEAKAKKAEAEKKEQELKKQLEAQELKKQLEAQELKKQLEAQELKKQLEAQELKAQLDLHKEKLRKEQELKRIEAEQQQRLLKAKSAGQNLKQETQKWEKAEADRRAAEAANYEQLRRLHMAAELAKQDQLSKNQHLEAGQKPANAAAPAKSQPERADGVQEVPNIHKVEAMVEGNKRKAQEMSDADLELQRQRERVLASRKNKKVEANPVVQPTPAASPPKVESETKKALLLKKLRQEEERVRKEVEERQASLRLAEAKKSQERLEREMTLQSTEQVSVNGDMDRQGSELRSAQYMEWLKEEVTSSNNRPMAIPKSRATLPGAGIAAVKDDEDVGKDKLEKVLPPRSLSENRTMKKLSPERSTPAPGEGAMVLFGGAKDASQTSQPSRGLLGLTGVDEAVIAKAKLLASLAAKSQTSAPQTFPPAVKPVNPIFPSSFGPPPPLLSPTGPNSVGNQSAPPSNSVGPGAAVSHPVEAGNFSMPIPLNSNDVISQLQQFQQQQAQILQQQHQQQQQHWASLASMLQNGGNNLGVEQMNTIPMVMNGNNGNQGGPGALPTPMPPQPNAPPPFANGIGGMEQRFYQNNQPQLPSQPPNLNALFALLQQQPPQPPQAMMQNLYGHFG